MLACDKRLYLYLQKGFILKKLNPKDLEISWKMLVFLFLSNFLGNRQTILFFFLNSKILGFSQYFWVDLATFFSYKMRFWAKLVLEPLKMGFLILFIWFIPASTGRTSAAVTAGLPINWCFSLSLLMICFFFYSQDVVVTIELSD